MKFAYTIWNDTHFQNIDELIATTKDIVDYYIITTWPYLKQDNIPVFETDGLENISMLIDVFHKCKNADKKVCMQVLPTPKASRGKIPAWWQGWVNLGKESEWHEFFNQFSFIMGKHLDIFRSADRWLIGAELTSTLQRIDDWKQLFWSATSYTEAPLGYSHHFSLPLKHYYNLPISLSVLFGYFFYRQNIYGKLLERLLIDPFVVPADQRNEVGKNLYHAPMINPADLDFIKLNNYFWYVMDRYYPPGELKQRWEKVTGGGYTIEFMPAVRSWLKKYGRGKEIWVENDLNIGFTSCPDEYYKTWWRIFIEKHFDIADMLVVWDNGDYQRWAKAIMEINKEVEVFIKGRT